MLANAGLRSARRSARTAPAGGAWKADQGGSWRKSVRSRQLQLPVPACFSLLLLPAADESLGSQVAHPGYPAPGAGATSPPPARQTPPHLAPECCIERSEREKVEKMQTLGAKRFNPTAPRQQAALRATPVRGSNRGSRRTLAGACRAAAPPRCDAAAHPSAATGPPLLP